MGTWLNSDGLYVKFGTTEAGVNKGGMVANPGQLHEAQVVVYYDDLNAHDASEPRTILSDNLVIPDGAWLKEAEFYVETAFAGATATLSFGLLQAADRDTEVDNDGIDATIAVTAIDAAGDTITCDGALIDSEIATNSLVLAQAGTATFTAGKGVLTLRWYVPHADQPGS